MSNGSKLAMLFALALSAASTTAVNAHPAILGNGPGGQAAAPIVKVDCYKEGCEYRRWHCWRRCDDCCEDYWRPRPCGPDGGCYHSRYYSHYRWGSYHRYWRRYWDRPGWED